ncbi:MAG TPA: hypothetical protein VFC45_00725 [Pseudolabrys sp.]|nr:hypothetical protein [Pseudolabrys sp.]
MRENISYGFTRNLLGLKPFGISIAVSTLIFFLLIFWRDYYVETKTPSSIEFALAAILIIDSIGWILFVTPKLVRNQAEAYAIALFETIEKE